jgi:hypothetical protein
MSAADFLLAALQRLFGARSSKVTGPADASKASAPATGAELRDCWSIGRMALPDWPEVLMSAIPHAHPRVLLRKYACPGEPETRLLVTRRELMVEHCVRCFSDLLHQPPQQVSAAALWDLVQIVHDMASPEAFEVRRALTTDWNGRRILLIEGRWKRENLDELHLFVGATGEPHLIDAISYLAPRRAFDNHRHQIDVALQSIRWAS